MRKEQNPVPLFEVSLNAARAEVDKFMEMGVQVPIPKDMAGGYTHETHKKNFFLLQKAGAIYQITQEKKYAQYIKDVFMAYAKMYPGLSKHPSERSYARGKLFWQCLNDANWLVYMSQAYDCIYDFLSKKERKHLEKNLFKPFADYISIENPQFFNRIHNHSTWGNAGVGMMALVMGDEELLNRALHGLNPDVLDKEAVDNDGGLISMPGQKKAGFFAQLDHAFSPDGYYTEGPYYQRYAMSPFILFAQALENHKPELKIFEYRDHLLQKAVYAILNQTDASGAFYPINDAMKGMSFHSRELVSAVDAVYYLCGRDATLLSVAQDQGQFQLDHMGFQVAKDIVAGKAKPFDKKSIELRDGAAGDEGAIGILRASNSITDVSCLFKYSGQGMGHGHFDKLSYSLYEGSTEVLQDYGSARWVNIDQKSGGGYLPENKSWAKQSIAHNTIVVDETSHFEGSTKKGNEFHSDPYFFDSDDPNIQLVSAKERNAYPGIELHRTLCLLKDEALEKPLLIDVFRVQSEEAHQYDLPFHYKTQLLSTNFEYEIFTEALKPLGDSDGYQHVWKEAAGVAKEKEVRVGWFSDFKFYELTTIADAGDDLVFGRIGANDPKFNLRRDAFFMLRKPDAKDALFVSAIQAHGDYSPVTETPGNPIPYELSLEILVNNREYSIIKISNPSISNRILMIANTSRDSEQKHTQKVGDEVFEWSGSVSLQKSNY